MIIVFSYFASLVNVVPLVLSAGLTATTQSFGLLIEIVSRPDTVLDFQARFRASQPKIAPFISVVKFDPSSVYIYIHMRVLLVDNSKPANAIFTPKLRTCLSTHAEVSSCPTLEDAVRFIDERWDAIVLSGSSLNMSQSVRTAALAKDLMVLLRHRDTPCLGVCFGMQLMAVAYGGEVERLCVSREGGHDVDADGPLLAGRVAPFFSHQDVVVKVPPAFLADAWDVDTHIVVGMHCHKLRRYGVQYHPECSDTTVQRALAEFLKMSIACQVSVGADLRLSSQAWGEIALLAGRTNIHSVSRNFRLSVEQVMQIWRDFRAAYRIPSILL